MGNLNAPIINNQDMDLFVRIARHGFVDMEYIHMFTYENKRKRTISDRINQLKKHNYLSSITTFIPPDYVASYRTGYQIITLGAKGMSMMKSYGYEINKKAQTIMWSNIPYRMYHLVQVATVCDTLEKRFQDIQSKWEVKRIYSEKDSVNDELPMQPDSTILLNLKNRKEGIHAAVFIEMERSYSSFDRIEKKLRNYALAIKKNIYAEKYGINISVQRVLFIAKTKYQYQGLMKKLQENIYNQQITIFCVSYQDLIMHPLDAIYASPVDGKKYKLLSKMEQ